MRQTQNASKKDNRKSILVIGLLLLLVAVIGFGGYTLSKYVTKKTVSENGVTVAKWGFTVETKDADKLFGSKYSAGKVADNDTALTVKADNAVVAPGTSGSMTFKIAGKAEVLAKVGVEMKAATDKAAIEDVVLKYKKGEDEVEKTYAPVKWTLTKKDKDAKTETVVNGGTLADVQTKLAEAYTGNLAIGTEINDEYTLSWTWAFEKTDGLDDADNLDTMLGMLSNGATFTDNKYVTEEATYTKVEANTTISFELVIKVEQVNVNA